jgi:hypothetical protein
MVAVLPGETTDLGLSVAQLSVAAMPAPDLTLDTFLRATVDEMGRLPGVISVATGIDDTLRPEHRPAATLTYVLAAGSVEQEPVAGYQVAFFNKEATALIVLTFTTTQAQMDDSLPDFEQIVRSVEIQ